MKVPKPVLLFVALLAVLLVAAVRAKPISPSPVSAEQRMFDFYRTKRIIMGVRHAQEVMECGKWTRYYAQKVGIEEHMETLLCLWHAESEFRDIPGIDGLSFGRAQTCYGYQARLRKWWLDRGEVLDPSDHAVSTQMAFGVAEFYQKLEFSHGDIFLAVARYNGCGQAAFNHAKRVFHMRKVHYGMKQPKARPVPCPCRKKKPQPK